MICETFFIISTSLPELVLNIIILVYTHTSTKGLANKCFLINIYLIKGFKAGSKFILFRPMYYFFFYFCTFSMFSVLFLFFLVCYDFVVLIFLICIWKVYEHIDLIQTTSTHLRPSYTYIKTLWINKGKIQIVYIRC